MALGMLVDFLSNMKNCFGNARIPPGWCLPSADPCCRWASRSIAPFRDFGRTADLVESGMRIAIVNDMPIAVEGMRQILVSGGRHEIAWVANDGAEAVECCRSDRPHLVLMDLAMPKVDGVEATRQIMAETPCPILIVTDGGETKGTQLFDAMGAGAIDAVRAPAFPAGVSKATARVDFFSRSIPWRGSSATLATRARRRNLRVPPIAWW